MTTDALFRLHQDHALRIARGFAAKTPANVAMGDLEQAALLGLWEWCSKHPDTAQTGWIGGLKLRVRGAIVDWLRSEDWLTRRARERNDGVRVVALEELGSAGSEDDGGRWESFLGAEHDESALGSRLDALEALSAELPERDRHVVIEHFGHDARLSEIAAELGVSAPRVSQLVTRAKRAMREHLERDPRLSVQVAVTPKFRPRDFHRELWLAQRSALLGITAGETSTRAVARILGVSSPTAARLMTGRRCVRAPSFALAHHDPVRRAIHKRALELMAGALGAAQGKTVEAGRLLGVSQATVSTWRLKVLPDAPIGNPNNRPHLPDAPLLAAREHGRSLQSIATEFGVSKRTVSCRLRRAVRNAEIDALRQSGLGRDEIAQRLGVSRRTVTYAFTLLRNHRGGRSS